MSKKGKKNVWQIEDKELQSKIANAKIPSLRLCGVKYIDVKIKDDLEKIPKTLGCYWIWTSEEVRHSFNNNRHPKPFSKKINGKKLNGEIIYNGIADSIRARIDNHLFSPMEAGRSGISLDVYMGNKRRGISHKKKIFKFVSGKKIKLPSIKGKQISSKAMALRLKLSTSEKSFINRQTQGTIYFRNGIDITERKHKRNIFRVFYISNVSHFYRDLLEKKWRDKCGEPKLCSYSVGR